MPIVNRDLDASQQVATLSGVGLNTAAGSSHCLFTVPYAGQVMSAMLACSGLSGAPNHSLWIQRMVVGSGATQINIGASLAAVAVGVSGAQTFTITSGLTNLVQAGDVISLFSAGANTGAVQVSVSVAIKALQDIRTNFGA